MSATRWTQPAGPSVAAPCPLQAKVAAAVAPSAVNTRQRGRAARAQPAAASSRAARRVAAWPNPVSNATVGRAERSATSSALSHSHVSAAPAPHSAAATVAPRGQRASGWRTIPRLVPPTMATARYWTVRARPAASIGYLTVKL